MYLRTLSPQKSLGVHKSQIHKLQICKSQKDRVRKSQTVKGPHLQIFDLRNLQVKKGNIVIIAWRDWGYTIFCIEYSFVHSPESNTWQILESQVRRSWIIINVFHMSYST
jgi:hypothetical protein